VTGRAWLWAGASLVAYLLAELATIPVAYLLAYLQVPHAVMLAAFAASRVLLAGLVVLILGRIILRPRPRASGFAWLVLAIGAGVSAVALVGLYVWSQVQFPPFDLDSVGVTEYLHGAVGLAAVAAFATLSAPASATRAPMVGVAVALIGIVALFALNVAGNTGPIDPEGVWLAAALGASLVYAVAVAGVTARRWMQPGAGGEDQPPG
jgi:hypothetical protein